MYPLLGVTAHWIDDEWNLRDVGLSLSALEGPHSGENISECFMAATDGRFAILDKVRLIL